MTLKLNGTNSEAAPAYAGDDADTGLQCGTNELKLVTGGTARATVDSSGRVLVGETSTSIGSTMVLSGRSDNATGGSRLYMSTATTSPANGSQLGGIYFSDDSENAGARIESARDGGTWTSGSSHPSRITFSTTADGASSPTERMRILSSGGLTFNGDTAQANALDDYEEGTWTPTINFDLAFTGGAYVVNEGFYTKIGRLVNVSCELALSSKGSSTGQVNIAGLPFTPNSDDESRASGVIGYYSDVSGIDFPIVILIEPNQTSFPLRDSGSASSSGISDSNLGNGFRFYFTITYMT